jgi:hypothetical protein
MEPLIIKAGTTMPELHALITKHVKLELNQSLTAVDIYVGDDHLRIACQVNSVDQIMEDIMKVVRIPGESVICHEAIELESSFVDYTEYPMCMNGRQLRYQLQTKFKLHWEYECRFDDRHYIKTTDKDLAQQFSESYQHCIIYKQLTR